MKCPSTAPMTYSWKATISAAFILQGLFLNLEKTEEFELSQDVVSVSIEEIDKDKWSEIYHNEIYGNEETLFVAPKYIVD